MIDVANGKPKNLIVPARRAAFADRIKTLREAAGLTQTELARRADIDRSYYAEVEAGLHSVSIDRIFAIADALSTSPRDLFTETPTPENPRSCTEPPRKPGNSRQLHLGNQENSLPSHPSAAI